MYYKNKKLIVLDTFDLDLVSKCPKSIVYDDVIREHKSCIRCKAFSQLARYCLRRAFRSEKNATEQTLKKKYNSILLTEGINAEEVGRMSRKDSGILADIIEFSKQHKHHIDRVGVEIAANFGRFSVRDELDAILCIQGQYIITKFTCDEHSRDDRSLMRYETIASSIWVREAFGIETNGICFVQLSITEDPIMRQIDMMLTTEQLKESIQSLISNYLEPTMVVKNEATLKLYRKKELANLPARFGSHCWDCRKCFNF